jgi:hypothetical protein
MSAGERGSNDWGMGMGLRTINQVRGETSKPDKWKQRLRLRPLEHRCPLLQTGKGPGHAGPIQLVEKLAGAVERILVREEWQKPAG